MSPWGNVNEMLKTCRTLRLGEKSSEHKVLSSEASLVLDACMWPFRVVMVAQNVPKDQNSGWNILVINPWSEEKARHMLC